MLTQRTIYVGALALSVLAACSGGKEPVKSSKSPAGSATPAATDADAADSETSDRPRRGGSKSSKAKVTVVRAGSDDPADADEPGRVTGVATFAGTPPNRIPIGGIANTQGCSEHATTPLTETVVVNDGKLQYGFVYISKGLDDWTEAPPADPVVLDQLGCLYRPHVVGVRAGQALHAKNSDPISHNVHVISKVNDSPNKTQGPSAKKPLEIVFEKKEVPVVFVCDIHPWMKAYACVVEHPFFAVTGVDGSFSLEGVPPGDYELTAWHEKLRKVKADVTVGPGGEVSVEFPFE